MRESDKALGFIPRRDRSSTGAQRGSPPTSLLLLGAAKQWFNDTTLGRCAGDSIDLGDKRHFGEWWLFGLWTIVTAVRESIPDDRASAATAAAFLAQVSAEMAARGAGAEVIEAGDGWMYERFEQYYRALAEGGVPSLMAAVAANVEIDPVPGTFAEHTAEVMAGAALAVRDALRIGG